MKFEKLIFVLPLAFFLLIELSSAEFIEDNSPKVDKARVIIEESDSKRGEGLENLFFYRPDAFYRPDFLNRPEVIYRPGDVESEYDKELWNSEFGFRIKNMPWNNPQSSIANPKSVGPDLELILPEGDKLSLPPSELEVENGLKLNIVPSGSIKIELMDLPMRTDTLRVAVYRKAGLLFVSATRKFTVTDLASGKSVTSNKAYRQWKFRKVEGGIETNLWGIHRGPIRLETSNPNGLILVGTELYRGVVDIIRDTRGVAAVNIVNVEEYLYGVLPKEVPEGWPPEALKAQAIASRGYALYRKLNNRGLYYDLDSTVLSQVYGGVKVEDPRTNTAVDETRGMVLTFEGQIIQSLFHAASGGHTEPVENVWGDNGDRPIPYLGGVWDPFDADGGSIQWSRTLNLDTIRQRLNRSGIPLGKIKSVEVVERNDETDRVLLLKINHNSGSPSYLSGNSFRMALGPTYNVKSTIFRIEFHNGALKLSGSGFGHGVGLPQESARAMASQGYDYLQILSYFYPGVKFKRFDL